jgi:predicted nucleic acid-binding protein
VTPAEPPKTATLGVYDTSVFIAAENGRPIHVERLPAEAVSTVITLAELNAGVLAAPDTTTRARRLRTLTEFSALQLLDVDSRAAEAWARLRVHLYESGRGLNVNDLWIAAIALANQLPILTQDDDFQALDSYPGISIIRV